MAGLNVNLWHGMSADIGYRYAYLGAFSASAFAEEGNNLIVPKRHDFRMGLRYAF